MTIRYYIQEALNIPLNHIKEYSPDNVLCLVHSTWLNFINKGLKVPSDLLEIHTANENFLNFFIACPNLEQTDSNWKCITVHHWPKNEKMAFGFLKQHNTYASASVSYAQLIHYVTKANYKNLLEQAWTKYDLNDFTKKKKHKENYNHLLQDLIERVFKAERIEREDGVIVYICDSTTSTEDDGIHPNLLQVFLVVETIENYMLFSENIPCTLRDCLMFSPFILSGLTVQPLFVVYQLIQIMRSVHNLGLFMGPITLSTIKIKNNLWIQVPPLSWKCLHDDFYNTCQEKPATKVEESIPNIESTPSDVLDPCISTNTSFEPSFNITSKIEDDSNWPEIVQGWVEGSISNYDYLLLLNKLAGREKDNPKSHYVMPWIMDFSLPEGGWRDLSKSKFRLNKGDKQLDLIYESAVEASEGNTLHSLTNILQDSAITVPHHTSEVLADITYYVYKARRMPKSFLCQHVRQKWVPAEYPATIERLQEWTPDECIPEFFSDPTIFYSIHPDLNDLGIPWWCETPEDFIQKHRNALESQHISERLHNWIDLVFGYKLTGSAAVKSKNVCLPLVDCHTFIRNHGMVQLFSHPHPHKLSELGFLKSMTPNTLQNTLKYSEAKEASGDETTSSESSGKSGFLKNFRSKSAIAVDVNRSEQRPENQLIVLPKDFNCLSSLHHLESLNGFQCWTGKGKLLNKKNKTLSMTDATAHQYQVRDMLVLGCLISEMITSSYCKTLCQTSSLSERYKEALKIVRLYKQDIPRSLRNVIQLLLQVSPDYESCNEDMLSPFCCYPPVSSTGLPRPSPHQLLLPHIRTIPFPSYFPDLYMFLLKLDKFSCEIRSDRCDGAESRKLIELSAEKKVAFAVEKLKTLLPTLNTEGIELITPFVQELFENPHTALLSTWHMFGIVSQVLGRHQTCRKLLKFVTRVFETDNPSPKHLKLYHRSFLLQIIVGIGLQNFLLHFITILIEAIGGCKEYSSKYAESDHCSEKDLVVTDKEVNEKSEYLGDIQESIESKLNASDDNLPLSSDIANEEVEIFDLELRDEITDCISDSVTDSRTDRYNIECKNTDDEGKTTSFYVPYSCHVEDNKRSNELHPIHSESLYSQSAPNLTSFSELNFEDNKYQKSSHNEKALDSPKISNVLYSGSVDVKCDQNFNVSDVAAESMIWLAHRLGPVLSARYLTHNLLRMLTLCYDSYKKREVVYIPPGCKEVNVLSVNCQWLKGDINAFKVLDCLLRIASLYGEQFIMIQYIKHIVDLLRLCRKTVPATFESGLLGAMALLQQIIPYISDRTLMDNLQDLFVKDILHSVLRLISSLKLVFPGSGKSRTMIAFRVLDVMYTIGLRIGFEMTRKHLSGLLKKFFSCFDKVYNEKGNYKELPDTSSPSVSTNSPFKQQALLEMRDTFTPKMAFLSYIPFCKLAGGIHMEQTLKNDNLIRKLCLLYDSSSALSASKSDISETNIDGKNPQATHHRNPSLGQDESFVSGIFGKNVNVIGNRLDVHLADENHLLRAMGELVPSATQSSLFTSNSIPKCDISLIKKKIHDCQRHLKGNWLAYWDYETGRNEKDCQFDFKQIKLQTFTGHSGAVRVIEVLDNENSFLTSSKDKTVKLWSLRSCGDGTSQIPCQWTYAHHRKSVFAVSFLNSLRLVGSCDSTVHIWDPFLGSCIKQLEPTKGSPVTVLEKMPDPSMTFLAATSNSTIRFLDARTCQYMHEFKVNVGTTGLIRSLAVSPNGYWIAVGHSTGMLSVLDVRTGLVIGTWLGHEGEVLQLKAFNNSLFVTSSLDHSLTTWGFENTQTKCNLKGPMEPVTSICFYGNVVISGTSGNRIGLHSSLDKHAVYTSTRLRSDIFKGVLTTLAFLPLNRLLLLGTDNGNTFLLC